MLKRLVSGIGANVFSQLVVAIVQIALVPIMASKWGLQNYGAWILMSTVPSYLALGDFGFGTAAGNDMTMKVARGENKSALATFQSAWTAIMGFSIPTMIGVALIILSIPNTFLHHAFSIDSQEARTTLLALVGYGLICLQGSILSAGFKSSGNYAIGTSLGAITMLLDGIVAALVVISGASLHKVAIAQLTSRTFSLFVQAIVLLRVAPWLSFGNKYATKSEIVRLWKPAAAVMALPASQSILLQGSTVVVGIIASPAAVPSFTAVRTLTRLGVQLVSLFNHAIMPELSRISAVGDRKSIKNIVISTIFTSLLVTIPFFIGLILFGKYIVNIWTHGAIKPEFSLILVMAMVMVVNTNWHPLSNLLLAVNRHNEYSYKYLISVCISTLIGIPLCKMFGSTGVAVAILLLDIYMLYYVSGRIHSILLFDNISLSDIRNIFRYYLHYTCKKLKGV